MAKEKFSPKVRDTVVVIVDGVPVSTRVVKINECTSLNPADEVCVNSKIYLELNPEKVFTGEIYKDKAEMLAALGDKI